MFESWPELWGGGYPAYRTTLRKFLWFRTVTGGNAPQYDTVIGRIVSFITRRAAPLKIEATLSPIQSGTGDPSPENIRPISGHTGADIFVKAEYDAQATPTVTITFGQTVYGCNLVVNEDGSGSVVSNFKIMDLGNANWSYDSHVSDVKVAFIIDRKTGKQNVICSAYKTQNVAIASMSNGEISTTASFTGLNVMIKDSRFVGLDATQVKQVLSGVQLVYELATPITIPLTPGQVNALLGNNTVWVDDSDEIKVTYRSN